MLVKYRLEVTQIWRNTLNVGDTKFTSTSWVVRGNEGVAQMLLQTWPNCNSKWGLSNERLLKCCSKHDLRPRGKEKLAEEMSKVTQKMLKLKRGLRWQSRLFQTNLAVPEERRLLKMLFQTWVQNQTPCWPRCLMFLRRGELVKCSSKHGFRTRLYVGQMLLQTPDDPVPPDRITGWWGSLVPCLQQWSSKRFL